MTKGPATYLRNISWWIESNGRGLVIEAIAIKVEEVHQQVAKMMLLVHVAALDLWHQLQHAHNQADDRKSTNATIDRLVHAAHQQKMLDERNENGHGRILLLPGKEGLHSVDSINLLKRNVHPQSSALVNVLDDGHLGTRNHLNVVSACEALLLQELPYSKQEGLAAILGLAAVDDIIREEGEIDISSGQVQTRRERAKWVDFGITIALTNQVLQLVHKAPTDTSFEISWLDVLVKVDDLLV